MPTLVSTVTRVTMLQPEVDPTAPRPPKHLGTCCINNNRIWLQVSSHSVCRKEKQSKIHQFQSLTVSQDCILLSLIYTLIFFTPLSLHKLFFSTSSIKDGGRKKQQRIVWLVFWCSCRFKDTEVNNKQQHDFSFSCNVKPVKLKQNMSFSGIATQECCLTFSRCVTEVSHNIHNLSKQINHPPFFAHSPTSRQRGGVHLDSFK